VKTVESAQVSQYENSECRHTSTQEYASANVSELERTTPLACSHKGPSTPATSITLAFPGTVYSSAEGEEAGASSLSHRHQLISALGSPLQVSGIEVAAGEVLEHLGAAGAYEKTKGEQKAKVPRGKGFVCFVCLQVCACVSASLCVYVHMCISVWMYAPLSSESFVLVYVSGKTPFLKSWLRKKEREMERLRTAATAQEDPGMHMWEAPGASVTRDSGGAAPVGGALEFSSAVPIKSVHTLYNHVIQMVGGSAGSTAGAASDGADQLDVQSASTQKATGLQLNTYAPVSISSPFFSSARSFASSPSATLPSHTSMRGSPRARHCADTRERIVHLRDSILAYTLHFPCIYTSFCKEPESRVVLEA